MPRVLVVDDEYLIRRLLERVLRESGHEVATARHPAEALSILAEGFLCDVVVTDFSMPGMNGAELVQEIRAQHGESAPSCILISGTLDVVLPSQRPLFEAMISKPFTPAQIRNAVAQGVRASRHAARSKPSGTRLKPEAAIAEGAGDGTVGSGET